MPTPNNVLRDLVSANAVYRVAGIGRLRRSAFLVMRVAQRGAYWAGWTVSDARIRWGRLRTPPRE